MGLGEVGGWHNPAADLGLSGKIWSNDPIADLGLAG